MSDVFALFSHGLSYAIAGNVKDFKAKDYPDTHPIVVRIPVNFPNALLMYEH